MTPNVMYYVILSHCCWLSWVISGPQGLSFDFFPKRWPTLVENQLKAVESQYYSLDYHILQLVEMRAFLILHLKM